MSGSGNTGPARSIARSLPCLFPRPSSLGRWLMVLIQSLIAALKSTFCTSRHPFSVHELESGVGDALFRGDKASEQHPDPDLASGSPVPSFFAFTHPQLDGKIRVGCVMDGRSIACSPFRINQPFGFLLKGRVQCVRLFLQARFGNVFSHGGNAPPRRRCSHRIPWRARQTWVSKATFVKFSTTPKLRPFGSRGFGILSLCMA